MYPVGGVEVDAWRTLPVSWKSARARRRPIVASSCCCPGGPLRATQPLTCQWQGGRCMYPVAGETVGILLCGSCCEDDGDLAVAFIVVVVVAHAVAAVAPWRAARWCGCCRACPKGGRARLTCSAHPPP